MLERSRLRCINPQCLTSRVITEEAPFQARTFDEFCREACRLVGYTIAAACSLLGLMALFEDGSMKWSFSIWICGAVLVWGCHLLGDYSGNSTPHRTVHRCHTCGAIWEQPTSIEPLRTDRAA
jgi:hypothetical protein